MMMSFRTILLALALAVLAIPPGLAGANADIREYRLYLADRGAIPWQSLSPQEQEALREYQGSWDQYSSDRQERIRKGAQRYLELPPEKRHQVEQQRRQYQELSPKERKRLREEYRRQRD